jgi:CDP-diacylglycerol--serine O-phosphatidyltransferase
MLKQLPNALTSCNLFCGCLGIIQCFEGNLQKATLFMLLAAVFDFFDGFVARAVKANSAMGKELDSLADCVSFGALPAFMLYKLMLQSTNLATVSMYLPYSALLIAVFSALRLAKFNIDTRQTDSFIGVPTPADAILIGSFPYLIAENTFFAPFLTNIYVLLGVAICMSYLMMAELPLIALKFKDFSWKNNQYIYILLVISIVMLVFLQFSAVPMIMLLYIILSVIKNTTKAHLPSGE